MGTPAPSSQTLSSARQITSVLDAPDSMRPATLPARYIFACPLYIQESSAQGQLGAIHPAVAGTVCGISGLVPGSLRAGTAPLRSHRTCMCVPPCPRKNSLRAASDPVRCAVRRLHGRSGSWSRPANVYLQTEFASPCRLPILFRLQRSLVNLTGTSTPESDNLANERSRSAVYFGRTYPFHV
jgi:hypothetical protein